jgi:alpha-tubulin suppressor-like RCC1 family protein
MRRHGFLFASALSLLVGPLIATAAATTSQVSDHGIQTSEVSPSAPALRQVVTPPPAEPSVIAGGSGHTCAIRPDRRVACWGDNASGQLGDQSFLNRSSPVAAAVVSNVREVTAGDQHSCAVTRAQTVLCWGANEFGEGGQGSTRALVNVPTPVPGLSGVVAIAAGGSHTCVIVVNGSVLCWGANLAGELGRTTVTDRDATPRPVAGIENAIGLALSNKSTCALLADHTVRCWGSNFNRQLGREGADSATPSAVTGLVGVVAIRAGGSHVCALLRDSTVQCWGRNASGQLGDGTTNPSSAPRTVQLASQGTATLTGVTALSAGGSHTCAIVGVTEASTTLENSVWCWGSNTEAALTGIRDGRVARVAESVRGFEAGNGTFLGGLLAMGSGDNHNCGLNTIGLVLCWGDNNYNQLGRGSSTLASPPTTTQFTALVALVPVPIVPTRITDTRAGSNVFGTTETGPGRGGLKVQLFGPNGIPPTVKALVATVTATNPEANGFIGLTTPAGSDGCSDDVTSTSILNFGTGQTVANTVIVPFPIFTDYFCLYRSANTNVIVDVTGFYPFVVDTLVTPKAVGRLLDSRAGGSTVDGVSVGLGRRPEGSVTELVVSGRANVPGTATAAALNITAADSTTPGYVTVWPCGAPRPNASTLNFRAGQTVANAMIGQIGANGKVCLFTSGATHLIVDLMSAMDIRSNYVALNPQRFLDSRPGAATADSISAGIGLRASGSVTEFRVGGRLGVPTNARLVAINLTVSGTQGAGYLTVWPCGSEQPNASTLNFGADATVANGAMVAPGDGGRICVYTPTATHLIVDVNGYE